MRPSPTSRSCAARRRQRFGLAVEFRQSNHEGEIVDWIQEAARQGRRRHRDQCRPPIPTRRSRSMTRSRRSKLPVIEVHITNIFARESFRQHSYVVAGGQGRDLRLRHRRLCARDHRARGDDRRGDDGLTARPGTERRWRPKASRRPGADPRAGAAARRDRPHRDRDRARGTARPRRPPAPIMQAAAPPSAMCRRRRSPRPPPAAVDGRSTRPSIRASSPRRWSAPPIWRPSPARKPFVEVGSDGEGGRDAAHHRGDEDDEPDPGAARRAR